MPKHITYAKLTSRFEDALVYVSNLHSGQTRKASGVPYIAHLLSVTALVIEDGGDEDEVIAALLHDAIEDRGGSAIREEIQRRFGERVTSIVDGCTDAETMPKPPWRQRKERFIKSLSQASSEVRRVIAADKLHNACSILSDFRRCGEAIWERFNGGKEGTLWYYHEVTKVLRQRDNSPLVEELERVVTELETLVSSEEYPKTSHKQTGIWFDEGLGTLLIHLNKEDIGLSDERVQFHDKVFEPKEEVHITIIGKSLGRQLKEAGEEDPLIGSQIRQAIAETDWSYKVTDKMYHVSKDKQKRGPQGDLQFVHAESIILMVDVVGIQNFYEKLDRIIQMELEAPPTHITLYTYGDPVGIGLASQAEFREFVTREVLPDELKRLSTARGGERRVVLVDMDGVIADFEGGFLKNWRERHPDKPSIPLEHRTTFYIADQYPQEWRELVRQIMLAPGFYRNLEPIPGSIAALQEMSELGFEVFICSRPLSEYKNCVLEKYEWVEEHLGEDWVKRIILTRDKTIIKADILIDDRPEIRGVAMPSWEHILCDQPYNREERRKRRLSWKNWRDVILSEMDV